MEMDDGDISDKEHPQALDMLTRLFSEAYRIDDSEWGGETEYVNGLIDICRQRDSGFDMTSVNICKSAGYVRSGIGNTEK